MRTQTLVVLSLCVALAGGAGCQCYKVIPIGDAGDDAGGGGRQA